MLDFPASPTTGQTFTGPNGVMWTWDSAKWVAGTTTGTTYAPIASPVFTGDPRAPTPAAGDNDTSIATSAFVQAAVAPALANVGRNLIHNPLFNVQQRGLGPFTASGFTLDRWYHYFGGAGATTSLTPLTAVDAHRTQIGDEACKYVVSCTYTGTAGAADATMFYQNIEDVRRLGGKTVTVSFWAANSAALRLGVSINQNFGTGGSPSAGVSMAGQATAALTTSFVRYSMTFAVPSTIGKTLGTNSDSFTSLVFWFSSGANNAASAGGIGAQSGSIYLWGVQLEIGPTATPLEKPDPRYDLANCQRFFFTNSTMASGYNQSGLNTYVRMPLPTTMRAIPTVAASGVTANNCTLSVIGSSPSDYQATLTATATTFTYANYTITASADL